MGVTMEATGWYSGLSHTQIMTWGLGWGGQFVGIMVGSVDIEWKYYQRNSLQISNLQSFQLPSIGNDILSCKIKSKGSGWIKGLYSERSAIIVQ